jgi:hypothetical protein
MELQDFRGTDLTEGASDGYCEEYAGNASEIIASTGT